MSDTEEIPKYKFKALIEFIKKEETSFGCIGHKESGLFMQAIGKIAKKFDFDCYMKGYPKEKLNYKPTGKDYVIKTVDDIAKLTPLQFEFFIDDLREYCNTRRGLEIMREMGVKVEAKNGFVWQDTGLNEKKLDIEMKITNKI